MDGSSKQYKNWCASKSLSSSNITAHAFFSVAGSVAMMVEIFRLSQKRDLLVMVAVLVSEVNF